MIDFVISGFAVIVAAGSMIQCIGIWRVRNGGMLTRALCAKLLAFSLWAAVSAATIMANVALPEFYRQHGTLIRNVNVAFLCAMQAVVIFWIIPRFKK